MMASAPIAWWQRACAIVLMVVCLTGCEVDSTEGRIEIIPGSVSLRTGQSRTFSVSGGHTYSWSLNPDDGSGSLDRRQGDTVVFTLHTNVDSAGNPIPLIEIICISTIPGVSGGANNSDAYTQSDTAYVIVEGDKNDEEDEADHE